MCMWIHPNVSSKRNQNVKCRHYLNTKQNKAKPKFRIRLQFINYCNIDSEESL